MNILNAENLTKVYGEKILFDDISFSIEEGDKIGILGVNGAGKTSLIKTIAGIDVADRGKITKSNSVHIEYLPQESSVDAETTVLMEVFKGTPQ